MIAVTPVIPTSSSLDDTVTSSNRGLQIAATRTAQLRETATVDDGRRQLDRRKGSLYTPVTAALGVASSPVGGGPIRKKPTGRRGPYEGLLVSQLLAKQKGNISIPCNSNASNSNSEVERDAAEYKRGESAGNFIMKTDVNITSSVRHSQEQDFLPIPAVSEGSTVQMSQSTAISIVPETTMECTSTCFAATLTQNAEIDQSSGTLIEEINQKASSHSHIQSERVERASLFSSKTGADQQQQRHLTQHQLLVATVDASQIYQQPLQVYCSSTTGPGHPSAGILLSPQQSAELVLQNNINNINNMNNLAAAAAAANIGNLNGSTMNGIVNTMVQHHNNHAATVNHLNNLNAAVSNISSAQVLLSASAPQLLTYSSVLNPLPVPTCPSGVSPIAVLGVSSSISPISIVGVGPPQQLPLPQMSPQMHGTLQLQNSHPQLLSPPQTSGPQPGQTQGGTLCSMALPLGSDSNQVGAGTGSGSPCPPASAQQCTTVQLYNVTTLADGGMGAVLLQTTSATHGPSLSPAASNTGLVPPTCSAID
ncbi:hypothetical protein BIW11_00926 [Tropilaelaps mercedesae]|uniref:Uncharacterized protein n=1 Tax=Tropilaelaps mercedesae TaxID=418985 RepID=A0A1V9XMH0_9ACAR|nr:hypothetical protein BIW11_00926 [Tropilaelaps mercedesae]